MLKEINFIYNQDLIQIGNINPNTTVLNYLRDIKTIIDKGVEVAIVIGGESNGIRSQVQKECDFIGSLPISEKIESLNVSVATAIVLYEAVRQRRHR